MDKSTGGRGHVLCLSEDKEAVDRDKRKEIESKETKAGYKQPLRSKRDMEGGRG